jgi:uncharacterized protein (DUF427 family)
MRVRFRGAWIADSENVILLFEPDRYPVAYFPESDIGQGVLHLTEHITQHRDLGPTSWYAVRAGAHKAERAAWQHIDLPVYADMLKGRVAFACLLWMRSSKRMNGSWVMPLTAITALTFARLHAISWCDIRTEWSRIPVDR